MSLAAYKRKRDFRRTPEPAAARPRRTAGAKAKAHRFVVQKHAASRLHYDFRLEIGGTLKSWAVPKGVPFAKAEKRLAVHVEDHPVSYIAFEGTIPEGQYGGGTVMVWDTGTFETLGDSPAKDYARGRLHLVLAGKKLKGEWHLVRFHGEEENQWLLIRGGEDMRPVSRQADDRSVLSGKSMRQLGQTGRVWESKPRAADAKKSFAAKLETKAKTRKAAAPPAVAGPPAAHRSGGRSSAAAPAFFEPMKALLVTKPPAGDWLYEIKFDGFRALALKGAGETRLLSRNEKDLGAQFPAVAEAVAALEVHDCILDGEIVALDAKGRSSFQLLQAYELGETPPALLYYVFDLPRLDGKDLRELPLEERRARLAALLSEADSGLVRFSTSLGGDAPALLRRAKKLGLEGLIGKRAGSRYESGRRSGAWIKLKLHHEQEFVIGGYTPPGGSRPHLGALLVGVHDKAGKLVCTGKVGTGFNAATLRALHARLEKIRRPDCPFANLPATRASRFGKGLTASALRDCRWVKPSLVCQLRFSEWTRDGSLRQPVFLGLREDKDPREVVREKAKAG